jgi:hypothetical protein
MGRKALTIQNDNPDANIPDIGSETLGQVMGTQTGEEDRDTVAGGWQGTDDATSTAPSDMPDLAASLGEDSQRLSEEEEADSVLGRASAGGMHHIPGGVTDIRGTPVEESKDWEHDPIERQKR